MEGDLAAAEAAVADLEAQLAEGNARIAELQAEIESLNAQSATDSEALESLRAELTAQEEESASLAAQLEEAVAEYEAQLAELQAYRISRDLADGEAMTSTGAMEVIHVAGDGVTGAWSYTNGTLSGNAVELSIELDGVEIYRSELLEPGDSLAEIALSEPLTAGTHEAVAVTTVYGDDGEAQFASRVPVLIEVAG